MTKSNRTSMHMTLSPDTIALLTVKARYCGLSVRELMRVLIEEGLEGYNYRALPEPPKMQTVILHTDKDTAYSVKELARRTYRAQTYWTRKLIFDGLAEVK